MAVNKKYPHLFSELKVRDKVRKHSVSLPKVVSE